MTRATITAIFRDPDEVTIALKKLKTANHEFDQASEMVGALIKPAYSYGAQQSLWKRLTAWTLVGAVVGGATAYFMASADPTLQMPLVRQIVEFVHSSRHLVVLGAVMAYAVVGASIGQLVGGLLDVVFAGSLEDRGEEDVSGYTLSVQADDLDGEAELKQIFTECGCLQIETNSLAA
jgi:hypothetical protein